MKTKDKKVMAKSTIPRFTIDKKKKSKTVLAKLSIPTVPIEELGSTIEKLLKQAQSAGVKPVQCRGVISLY